MVAKTIQIKGRLPKLLEAVAITRKGDYVRANKRSKNIVGIASEITQTLKNGEIETRITIIPEDDFPCYWRYNDS